MLPSIQSSYMQLILHIWDGYTPSRTVGLEYAY